MMQRPRWSVAASFALACALPVCVSIPSPAIAQDAAGLLQEGDLAGLRLRNIGPAEMSGRIVDVAVVESDPYTFYVASATGGLWKTTDNGVTYEPVFDHQAVHSIGDVAVSQTSPEIVWVGTGERANRQSSSWGDGVYKSPDGGKTWSHMGLDESRHVGRIVIHPEDPDIVYVAAMGHLWGANEERGLYRSTDGGESWDRILYVDADTGVADVAMDPENPDILYAAAYQRRRTAFGFHGGGPGSGLYCSEDGGDTWTELTAAAVDPDAPDNPDHPEGTLVNGLPAGEYGRIGISIHRADPRIVYVSIEQGSEYSASTTYDGERYAGTYRSEDRGRTWRHMSDWNPRPMYASQILVDPNDPQRVYHENSFSYSDDGGATWTVPRQSIHSDDRFLWVDPRDSRHLIKASDGALGISYDRGESWLWASNLPVSQYYHVGVDMADPYRVLGGLQDNGVWIGPNETYRSEGILNDDWRPIGGGDGFVALSDPTDPDTVYVESQYLGLTRVDLATGESREIRPGNPRGYAFGRRNWRLFGRDEEMRLLEEEMEPANWNGPFILSPHDPGTLYAGTENLYVSRDGGASWTDLGRMSGEWERSEVEIMGQAPTARVASLDDGVPYFATATTIDESPLRRGLLVVGTDDGNVQISRDGGATFENVVDRIPGVPPRTWVADVAFSPHDPDTILVAFDGHRSDDTTNYLFRTDDGGGTWGSIVGDMPPGMVVRSIGQDEVNPDLLYAGTEFGFFLSIDGGEHWMELGAAMPTVAVNDFVIHPRDEDLVLGTHGRGVWILDSVRSLRELTPQVVASDMHLFSIAPARMMRRSRTTGGRGDTMFRGENPPVGAIIDYWLGADLSPPEERTDGEEEAGERRAAAGDESAAGQPEDGDAPVRLTVHDASGALVRTLEPSLERGVNRVVWDLRHEPLPQPATLPEPPDPARADRREGGRGGRGGRGASGPLVVPGEYTVRLEMDGRTQEQSVVVDEDPRVHIPAAARRDWTRQQLEIGDFFRQVVDLARPVVDREQSLRDDESDVPEELHVLRQQLEQLQTRIMVLRGQISSWTGPATADQRSALAYYRQTYATLADRWQAMEGER